MERSPPDELALAYYNWDKLSRYFEEVQQKYPKQKEYAEASNILTRFFLDTANGKDPREAWNKALHEMDEKRLTRLTLPPLPATETTEGVPLIKVQDGFLYLTDSQKTRVLPIPKQLQPQAEKMPREIALLLLRYHSFFTGNGLFWALPRKFWRCVNPDYECFAWPGQQCSQGLYFSLYESDSIFGSLGDFLKYKGGAAGVYVCNPPYTEYLLERSAKKVISILDHAMGPTTIYYLGPAWDDSAGIILLRKNRYRVYDLVLHKGCYRLATATGEIWGSFNARLFVLSNTQVIPEETLRESLR